MLKKILIALAFLVVLVGFVGLVLPGSYRVERSALIHAPPEVLHGFVADLERWKEWTPWQSETSAGTQWVFGGPRVGVGAVRTWSGEHGRGTLVLTQADPRTGVAYDTSLEDGHSLIHGRISFTPSDAGTRVTWVEEGSVGANPLLHYLLPLVQARLGARFEAGLARLQTLAEATPVPVEVKPAPLPVPVQQAAAPARPPDASAPPGGSGAVVPPDAGTAVAEVPAATSGAAEADAGGGAVLPAEGTAAVAPVEKPPTSGTEPAVASPAPARETAPEKPAGDASLPAMAPSAPVAGQTAPPT